MKFYVGLCLLLATSAVMAATPTTQIRLLKDPNSKNNTASQSKAAKNQPYSLERLEKMFALDNQSRALSAMLQKQTLMHGRKAVPLLIKVMKEGKYPEQNRWQATMLLGRIMGKKSAPFIAKFVDHPHWMMRVASLKALLALRQDSYHAVYSKALKDSSLIVRVQALDNISQMGIKPLAPQVWRMMYDASNYSGDAGSRKRTSIVKSVIRTVGDLKYQPARAPMAKLIQKAKYQDLSEDLDYSLEKITGTSSPDNLESRRKFWSGYASGSAKRI